LREISYRAANDSAQGVPGPLIKPVEELIEAICGEMVCRSVIKPEAEEKKRGLAEYNHTHKETSFSICRG